MRVAFAGTPAFAAAALGSLVRAGHEVVLALTQPDRPSGRGMRLTPSAVKTAALGFGIPVLTPPTLKDSDPEGAAAVEALERSLADVLIVAAYGLLLPERVLNACRGIGPDNSLRSLNIHASLLPRWRGAAPVQRAIEAGDAETGVCIMRMERGLDTGPVVARRSVAIAADETAASLTEKLASLGAELICEVLGRPGELSCSPQPAEGVTYARKVLKSESAVDWTEDAETIARRLRAFTPFPLLSARLGGETIRIHAARAVPGSGRPGEILGCGATLTVACGRGAIECRSLQRPGKAAMAAPAFIQSTGVLPGDLLQ